MSSAGHIRENYTQGITKPFQTRGAGWQPFLTQQRAFCASPLTLGWGGGGVYTGIRVGFERVSLSYRISSPVLRRGHSLALGAILGLGWGQPPPGTCRAQSPGSCFWVNSNAMAANCRVWHLRHIPVEATTCGKATRVPLPGTSGKEPWGARLAVDALGDPCAQCPAAPFSPPGPGPAPHLALWVGLSHLVCGPILEPLRTLSAPESR